MNRGNSCPFAPASSSTGSEPKAPAVHRQQNNANQSTANSLLRVKRRKTKKERNSARFNQSDGQRFLPSGSKCPFVRKKNPRAHSGFVRVVPPFAIRGECNSNPIIITQGRLTHHMGLFHGEVKSIDIKRLDLVKDAAKEVQPDNIAQLDTGEGNLAPRLDPTPITVLEDQGGATSLKHTAPESHILGSKPLLSQNKERGDLTPFTQGSSARLPLTSPHSQPKIPNCQRQSIPVPEAAEKIFKMLDSRSLFPARNLVTETKKSILAKLKQQQRMLGTNLSPLSLLKKLNYIHRGMSVIPEGSGLGYSKKTDDTQTGHGPQSVPGQNYISPFPVSTLSGTSSMHKAQAVCADSCHAEMDLSNQLLGYRPGYKHKGQLLYSETGSHLCEGIAPRDQFSLMPESGTNVKWRPSCNDIMACTHTGHPLSETISPRQWDTRKCTTPIRRPLLDMFTVPGSQIDRGNWPGMAAECAASIRNRPNEHGASFGVQRDIWNYDTGKSPGFAFSRPCLDSSTRAPRLHCGELNPHRDSTFSIESSLGCIPRGLGCQSSVAPENFNCKDPKDSPFNFLQPKRSLIQTRTTETESPHPLFPIMTPSYAWRNIRDVRAPMSMDRPGSMWSQCEEDWPQRQLHTSHSTESENLFVSHPEGGSLRQALFERSSPDTWVFPRMKLY
ncbi:hypothetical protein XENTR_v10019208 [Xenopus tropicalis]|uniref:Proline-rich protein 19 n=1 Tax=Xenopus tropicalis TaxID=8364 RepID=A0A8J0SU93_XENTR|nr:proline-rich protein 19 [Xenopus tropicalis]XP_012822908.1 proline-rich protein 19 [Xenopus tropicalis]XP_012822909.1 proline-rich protein 19 [Xenopus tropicalis]KAE8593593.1 hypothetical protein XENTR_v10019208 [Xenopus tropicalis]|eukprot:XP_012822908.1 PREDICTED: proline-rich protein 19 [Xenopus tropicalis]